MNERRVKPAFHDADADTDILGRKRVGGSGESVSVSASWNADLTWRSTAHVQPEAAVDRSLLTRGRRHVGT